jgi:hypothetical protein
VRGNSRGCALLVLAVPKTPLLLALRLIASDQAEAVAAGQGEHDAKRAAEAVGLGELD